MSVDQEHHTFIVQPGCCNTCVCGLSSTAVVHRGFLPAIPMPTDGVEWVSVPADQWERIAAVVRAAKEWDEAPYTGTDLLLDASHRLTPDDIEAVRL